VARPAVGVTVHDESTNALRAFGEFTKNTKGKKQGKNFVIFVDNFPAFCARIEILRY